MGRELCGTHGGGCEHTKLFLFLGFVNVFAGVEAVALDTIESSVCVTMCVNQRGWTGGAF